MYDSTLKTIDGLASGGGETRCSNSILKASRAAVLFLGLYLLSAVSTANGQAANCFPPGDGCEGEQPFTTFFTLDDFPSCTLQVDYILRVCGGEFQFTIDKISQQFPPLGDCDEFQSKLFALYYGGGGGLGGADFSLFIADLFLQGSVAIGDEIFASILEAGGLGLYNCDGGLRTFTAAYYQGSCTASCVSRDDKGAIDFRLRICDQDVCCERNRIYCLNDSGDVVVDESTAVSSGGAQCFNTAEVRCPEGTLFTSPCFFNCNGG